HQKYSGKKITYFDPELNESYVPYVVETSIGLDRMFLQVISASYSEEEVESATGQKEIRVVLRIPPVLAPVTLAVLPLIKKDGLPEKAREIIDDLKFDFKCQYDEKDSIGKRYRRMDAIGTPFCVTVDHQTLEDRTVTIRYRDSMAQDRVPIEKVKGIISEQVSFRKLFEKL
ncbi:MAG: His/Gly/Thr/Pro-type tRNA ligase C-terminal domain-containing protein, partial [Prolixibacteraceae bacterium]